MCVCVVGIECFVDSEGDLCVLPGFSELVQTTGFGASKAIDFSTSNMTCVSVIVAEQLKLQENPKFCKQIMARTIASRLQSPSHSNTTITNYRKPLVIVVDCAEAAKAKKTMGTVPTVAFIEDLMKNTIEEYDLPSVSYSHLLTALYSIYVAEIHLFSMLVFGHIVICFA